MQYPTQEEIDKAVEAVKDEAEKVDIDDPVKDAEINLEKAKTIKAMRDSPNFSNLYKTCIMLSTVFGQVENGMSSYGLGCMLVGIEVGKARAEVSMLAQMSGKE